MDQIFFVPCNKINISAFRKPREFCSTNSPGLSTKLVKAQSASLPCIRPPPKVLAKLSADVDPKNKRKSQNDSLCFFVTSSAHSKIGKLCHQLATRYSLAKELLHFLSQPHQPKPAISPVVGQGLIASCWLNIKPT